MTGPGRDLLRLADSVLLPGFVGRTPPDWLRRRLGEGLGGVVLFSRNVGSLHQVAELTAALRAENPSLLVGVDEESGEVTRLEVASGSSRPGNYALGVVDDLALTEELARDLGCDLARAGVTIDFAPSADVNSNPDNPVIGLRSFGADAELVSRHTTAFVRGLQSAGVAACAKHFPGHGDTAVDSHHGVPVVSAGIDELAEVALRPFRAAIAEGVRSVMTGHLLVSAYDARLPATISHNVLTGLLREELGFEGMIITDGIEMAAVAGVYGLGGASARAIAAGADAICVGGERSDEAAATEVRDAIVAAVLDGSLPEERLADAAGRVAAVASWAAATRAQPTNHSAPHPAAPHSVTLRHPPTAQPTPARSTPNPPPTPARHPEPASGASAAQHLPEPTPDSSAMQQAPDPQPVSDPHLATVAYASDPSATQVPDPQSTTVQYASEPSAAQISDSQSASVGYASEPSAGQQVPDAQDTARPAPFGDVVTAADLAAPSTPAASNGEIGLVAARRALRITRRSAAPVLPLTTAPLVVELAPEMNLAIDKGTPWGVGEPLSKLLPGTTVTRLVAGEAGGPVLESLLAGATERPLVIVTRDAHRYPWQAEALHHLLCARPDAVVVEMGLPERSDLGAVHLATYGSARVCGQAAAEALTGAV